MMTLDHGATQNFLSASTAARRQEPPVDLLYTAAYLLNDAAAAHEIQPYAHYVQLTTS
jgi:hypothetical protein